MSKSLTNCTRSAPTESRMIATFSLFRKSVKVDALSEVVTS